MTVRLPPNGSKPVEKPETKNAGGNIDIGPGFFLYFRAYELGTTFAHIVAMGRLLALGLALGFNVTFPLSVGRYGRFEEAVLGDDATEEQKAQLRASVEGFVEGAKTQIALAEKMHLYDVPAGFMRTVAGRPSRPARPAS